MDDIPQRVFYIVDEDAKAEPDFVDDIVEVFEPHPLCETPRSPMPYYGHGAHHSESSANHPSGVVEESFYARLGQTTMTVLSSIVMYLVIKFIMGPALNEIMQLVIWCCICTLSIFLFFVFWV